MLFLVPLLLPSLASTASILNSSYVDPTFKQSLSNVISDSVASINAFLDLPNFPEGWIGENGFMAVAQWDYQQKTRTFYEQYLQNETHYASHPGGCYVYWHQPLADCFNDDSGWAGLTVLEGYKAYGNEQFLDWAKSVHEFISNHGFINKTVIEWGYLKGTHFPNNTLNKTCDGQSMYGGVYWQNGSPNVPGDTGLTQAAANTSIDSGSTANYALLSAELCQVTSNMYYCNRSLDALQFMDRFMIDPTNGFVQGHIDGNNCSKATNFVKTSTTGVYFNAYALLSNLTSNADALATARKTIIAAMTTDIWNTKQGVLANGLTSQEVVGLNSALVRSLNNVYPYMDSDVQSAIRQYANIQYWSLVNKDSNDPEKPLLYGPKWEGPYAHATSMSQLETIDVFNALIHNPASAFPASNATSQPVITA